MTDEVSEFHLAGDVVGSTPSQIAKALEPLATEKLRVTDGVELYGDSFELSIYQLELSAEEGGADEVIRHPLDH